MEKLKEDLRKKGWSDSEIEKAVNMIYHSTTHPHYLFQRSYFNKMLYWMSLLLLSICNFIISIFLIPFLLLFPQKFIDVVVVFLALIFGYMFANIINSIEHLEKKHHLILIIIVALISILNFFIIVNISNFLAHYLKINIKHDSIVVALEYAVFLLIPHIMFIIFGKNKPKIKNISR